MEKIIHLKPVFKKMIWGGNRMRESFGYETPGKHTGECWAISGHPNGDVHVIGGQYDGMAFSRLFSEHRELFGNIEGDHSLIPFKTEEMAVEGEASFIFSTVG